MKKYNPTTPGRRQMTSVDYPVSAIAPLKSKLVRLQNSAGRNFQGRITVRHKGGGVKKMYRLVDFRQDKLGVAAKIEQLEYDPYRTSFIAKVIYADGERGYLLAPQGLKAGDTIMASENALIAPGQRTILSRIPIGSFIYNIELTRGRGGQLARGAGVGAEVMAQENGYAKIKLPSGEIRLINWNNYASIGQVSNPENFLEVIGRAGRSRLMGRRPTVRGKAMNPRDHPYGGGEGRTTRGTRRPKTKWGKVTGGHKTRRKNKSNKMIIQRRMK